MRDFEHCLNVLELVTDKGIPFNLAVKSALKTAKKEKDNELRNLINASCGAVFRHHLSLERLIKIKYPNIEHRSLLILSLLLANKLFSKRIDEEKLFAFTKKETSLDKLNDFVSSISEPKDLISEDVPYGSDEYFSLKNNIPLWIIRMWRKNLGPSLSIKMFKTFNKKNGYVVRIDNNIQNDEDFFNKYPEFSKHDLPGLAFINETGSKKNLNAIKEGSALNIHAGYSFLMKDVDFDVFRGAAIYGGCSNSLLEEIYAKYGPSLKMDYLCGNQKHFFEVKNNVQRLGIRNLSVFECPYSALMTCISKPVHTLFLVPENSAFQRLSEESDYFLSISQDKLDEFINIQTDVLWQAPNLVEDGGYIIYVVPTLCRNETYGLIHNFLNERHEFKKVEEKQLLPFDKYHSMLYFAILRKEANHD